MRPIAPLAPCARRRDIIPRAVRALSAGRPGRPPASRSAIIRPTGTPAIVSIGNRPKFASTSAPTVHASPAARTTRDAEPIPPFRSKHDIPRPAPTAPRANARRASASACA